MLFNQSLPRIFFLAPIFLSCLVLVGCQNSAKTVNSQSHSKPKTLNKTNPLQATHWQLLEFQSMDDQQGSTKPATPNTYELILQLNGNYLLNLPCYQASGNWSVTPGSNQQQGSISFSQFRTTHAKCSAKEETSLDRSLMSQMQFIRSYTLKEDKLYLSLMADGGIYSWKKLKQADTASPATEKPISLKDPAKGGYLNWETNNSVDLQAEASTEAEKLTNYPAGTILDNLGCQAKAEQVWCYVQKMGGGLVGYVQLSTLKPAKSPNGSIITGPDDSALRIGKGDFDASASIACKLNNNQEIMQQCKCKVARTGGGYATVSIERPKSSPRLIFFRMGKAIGAGSSEIDSYQKFNVKRHDDLQIVELDQKEVYKIPDALVLGD
jgi:heat shock protein HslJ